VTVDPQTLLVAGLIAFMFLIRTISGGSGWGATTRCSLQYSRDRFSALSILSRAALQDRRAGQRPQVLDRLSGRSLRVRCAGSRPTGIRDSRFAATRIGSGESRCPTRGRGGCCRPRERAGGAARTAEALSIDASSMFMWKVSASTPSSGEPILWMTLTPPPPWGDNPFRSG